MDILVTTFVAFSLKITYILVVNNMPFFIIKSRKCVYLCCYLNLKTRTYTHKNYKKKLCYID